MWQPSILLANSKPALQARIGRGGSNDLICSKTFHASLFPGRLAAGHWISAFSSSGRRKVSNSGSKSSSGLSHQREARSSWIFCSEKRYPTNRLGDPIPFAHGGPLLL